MKRIQFISLLFVCLFVTHCVMAQTEEQTSTQPAQKTAVVLIRHADFFKPGTTTNKNILKGNVKLEHKDIVIYCDSMYQYADRNFIEAFGNVHAIQSDTLDLWGNFMSYDGNTQKAVVRRNVVMDNKQIVLTTNHLDYDAEKRIGYYFNGGTLKDSINTLISDFGYYFMDREMLFFKDSVKVYAPDYTLYSDTMTYHTITKIITISGPTHIYGENRTLYSEDGWYNSLTSHVELYKNNQITYNEYNGVADSITIDSVSGSAQLRKNIHLYDTVNKVIVGGEYGELYKNNEYAFVTQKALMTMVGGVDSLFIHGDTLTMSKDTLGNSLMKAFYNTKFFNPELQGLCDSMTYSVADSMVYLTGNPIVWASGNQMTATMIDMLIDSNTVKEFHLNEKAMIVNQVSIDKFNQIKGRNMTGYIDNNELHLVYVNGNGETIYYYEEKTDMLLNRSVSSFIKIYIKEKRIKDIEFIGDIKGTLTPLFMVTEEEKTFHDFKWYIALKPLQKNDIFIHIKPTENTKTKKGLTNTISPALSPKH
ncbi:organic solvent tolerance protein OstA [Odoribacter sp. OttesenSCG-928-J03]|nr:organic solvent tolerance protein OstA [Odoribacter sp. OttesenSCG-928-J03]MDL2283031.1 organic solvent tolerance protein OstA [Odoribacter sp. OttesenSCG-928-G04]MDL2331071.1 organic solvent tolerance protein OstA [Odoribacter sp. OttesenSCG-928-A06]